MTDSLSKVDPTDARGNVPFMWVSATLKGGEEGPYPGGCPQEWLQDGKGNTRGQWDTLLDIGFNDPVPLCGASEKGPAALRNADNVTLLVWEGPADDAVWATWGNLVPYFADLFDVKNPKVDTEIMRNTPFVEFTKMNTKDGTARRTRTST